ncbi:vomeronasal type-1 receptor 1-like, partial [Sarcophilus harrisii]|uniref:vomeronasal type-1 receptor 1-like n=1 Tax=Sarcophilus harrisii TaxID=9305 RepID=UPI00062B9828
LEIVLGVLGNVLLLYLHIFHLFTGHKTRPIGLIVINLALSNTLMILFRGVPWTMKLLQLKIFLDVIGCKILIYLQRVTWSICLCSTSLLSTFQAITISSSNTRWTKLKDRAPKFVIPFCSLLWSLVLMFGVAVFFQTTASWNSTDSRQNSNLRFCSLNRYTMTISKFIIWKSLYEGVFVCFIVTTSSYMMFILYKHHQQVRQTLGISLNPRPSPEIRATKTILLLVSIFLCFYSVTFIFIICMQNSQGTTQWMSHVSVLLTLCYPTFTPYVLISSDSQISNFIMFSKG